MYHYTISVKKDIYPAEAVLRAAYPFLDRCYIHVDEAADSWLISFSPKDGEADCEVLAKELENEILAQTIRLAVFLRTHTLRELLLARALSSTMIDHGGGDTEREDDQDIPEEELAQILTDWFDRKWDK